jgi:DNA polymerase-3 subunit gamma/tau
MPYQVLARRCRPQTFEDVIGQKHVTRTLKNAIKEGRIAHAFLFAGERGVGKTSIARILAKALNCIQGPIEQPCNQCPSCQEITAGTAIDVHEIDGASNTGVDDVRVLRENVRYMPSRDRYKIYIIDEVHMLSKPAFNALLKTLEEPPPHVIFMFATTEPEKIPDTIISRCLRFDLKRIATQEIVAHLEALVGQDNISISKRALYVIARTAAGSMRDAQSLLDRILSYCGAEARDADVEELLGRVDRGVLHKITAALLADDAQACLETLNTIYESGFDLRQFYYAYLEHLRDLMVVKVSRASTGWMDMPEEELKEAERLSAACSADDLQRYFRLWFSAEDEISRSPMPKIALEMCLLEMIQAKRSIPVDEVLQRLETLQQQFATGAPKRVAPAAAPIPPAAYSVKEDQAPIPRSPAPHAQTVPTQPQAHLREQPAGSFLDFIRQHNLPLASQLEHGHMLLRGESELVIELPANSFYLENIKNRETEKIIQQLGEEFFKRTLKLTVVAGAQNSVVSNEDDRDQERKKKRQEALRNPLVQKIIDSFDGEIVEVRTEE